MKRFREYLIQEEKAGGTVEKYMRDVKQFLAWLGDREVSKDVVVLWKGKLIEQGLAPSTVNGKLASLHCYLHWSGYSECRVKALKLQKSAFRDTSRELSRAEYEALLQAADQRKEYRLKLIMETICATGIRVSELHHITVEAIALRRAEIHLKGKIRVILLPAKLCRKLSNYAKKCGIRGGEIFLTNRGLPLSRKQIWAEMKRLSKNAGVEASKVFPHNLRHLFARCFYQVTRDLVRLADVLGHTNVETTRIYLISTGEEHARVLDQLRLIS